MKSSMQENALTKKNIRRIDVPSNFILHVNDSSLVLLLLVSLRYTAGWRLIFGLMRHGNTLLGPLSVNSNLLSLGVAFPASSPYSFFSIRDTRSVRTSSFSLVALSSFNNVFWSSANIDCKCMYTRVGLEGKNKPSVGTFTRRLTELTCHYDLQVYFVGSSLIFFFRIIKFYALCLHKIMLSYTAFILCNSNKYAGNTCKGTVCLQSGCVTKKLFWAYSIHKLHIFHASAS